MLVEFTSALRYLDIGQYEKGEELLKKALKKAEEQGLTHEKMSISCCYGQLLIEMQRKEEAERLLKSVMEYYGETAENEYEFRIAKELLENI